MRVFFDTEFYENGRTIDLISIGMVKEDGDSIYFETENAPELCVQSPWLMENVWPHLLQVWTPRHIIKAAIEEFIGDEKPEFWAYYADYDWVVLCQLYGRMIDLPKGWPMFCMDVKQLCMMKGNPQLPKQMNGEHHALADAKHCKLMWEFLQNGT